MDWSQGWKVPSVVLSNLPPCALLMEARQALLVLQEPSLFLAHQF